MTEQDKMVDTESARERFMGNEAMFSKFLYQFPDRSLYGELEGSVESGDVQKAFETAHTMKGIVANLSLEYLGQRLHPVVETLRAGQLPDRETWDAFSQAYRQTIDYIQEKKTQGAPLF